MPKTIENLEFVGISPKIERKLGKFHLDIHLVIIQSKTSKNVKKIKIPEIYSKISQN